MRRPGNHQNPPKNHFCIFLQIFQESSGKLCDFGKFKENNGQFSGVQNNPVFFEDSLFFTTGNGKVISLNAITGEKNWSIQSIKNIATRGITLDITGNERNFLFVPIGKKVFKISTTDGKMVKEFGEKGSIKVFTKSAPIINKNNLCIAQLAPAKIKCFNKNDGII